MPTVCVTYTVIIMSNKKTTRLATVKNKKYVERPTASTSNHKNVTVTSTDRKAEVLQIHENEAK